jgi:hypothetical protein
MRKSDDNLIRTHFSDRPGWKLGVQIAQMVLAFVAVLIAAFALIRSAQGTKTLKKGLDESVAKLDSISIQMSMTVERLTTLNNSQDTLVGVMDKAAGGLEKQAKVSTEVSELLQEQLTEMRKRPFLTLCFLELPANDCYSFFFDEEDLLKSHIFKIGIMNSGQKPSHGGTVILIIPPDLHVDTINALGDTKIERRKELETDYWKDCRVYWLHFGELRSGGSFTKAGKTILGGTVYDLATLTLSMPDTTVCHFRYKEHITWQLIYKISSEDVEGLYPQRWLPIYFGMKRQENLELERENREYNLYDTRFRP